MQKLFATSCLVLVANAIGFPAASGQIPDFSGSTALATVRRAIDQGNARWREGWAKGDPAMVASVFADDGVQLSGTGKVVKGRAQIRDRQNAAMRGADSGVRVTITTTRVWLDGDTAYETGRYRYEYTEKGKPGTDVGRYVTIWTHQRDGSWKLSMDMTVPAD